MKPVLKACGKWTAAVALGLAVLGTTAALADKSSNTFNWASRYPIDVIDPYANTSREAIIINGQLVWDTLIWRDPDSGNYKPLLATEWKWLDDTTLEFKLRTDVKWQNGQPLTVDDAVYTLNRIVAPGAKIGIPRNVNWIKGAEKTGTDTFKLFLKAPFPAAMEYLSSVIPIMPNNLYGPDGASPTVEKAVGTGPYRIVSFTPSVSTEVELTGSYFAGSPKGQPTIKRIVNRTIPDNSTQIAELLSGGTDWIWNVAPDQAKAIEKKDNLSVVSAETMRLSVIQFNTRDTDGGANPLKDKRVRQAIAYAIDRDRLIKSMVGAGAEIPLAACYKTQFGCEQNVKQYPFSADTAKKLLAEAGYADNLTLDIMAFRSRDWTAAVAGMLNRVGIKTTINYVSFPAGQERHSKNQDQLYFQDSGWFSINDASAALDSFFVGDSMDSTQDKEITEWDRAASSTTDAAKRKELFSKSLHKIADEMYLLPLWSHPNVHAFKTDLDFKPYPDENPRFYFAKWK
jgi:peptide/nickel transport system substrate-binding protein